jgi:phosphatidylinositol alpha-1,6-mannosyltransferase
MSLRLQILTPVFPPAVGGIEALALGLADRWPGPVQVLTLQEQGWAEWDDAAPYPIRRVGNVPRGGRRAMARLGLSAALRTRAFRPDAVLSMHVRCVYAASMARLLSGAAWLQYYHAKEVPTWIGATRWCAARSDHGIAVSRYTKSLVEVVAQPSGPLSVLPPGISPSRLRSAPGQRPTVLTVSRIDDAYKGHDVLLDALPMIRERVPDVQWVVVGDGARLDWLREQVVRRGLAEAVQIKGRLGDDARDALLASAHVFALPSRVSEDGRTGEGFGIVYAEAAAAGLPVVAADLGGSVDAVRDGVTGLLVDPLDARAVAAAVISLLTDSGLRGTMAAAGPAWSRQFEWDNVAARFQELAHDASRRAR